MMWIFGMVVLATCLVLFFAFVTAIVIAVIELLVRLTLGVGLAVATGIVVGLVAAQAGANGTMIGLITAVLGLVPALLLVGRWRSSRCAPSAKVGRGPVSAIPDTPFAPYEQAWATAKRLAPKSALDGAQDASARVLALAEREGSLNPEIIDFAIALRRHVPALVSDTEELLTTADREERRAAVAELIADLCGLGEQAGDLLARQGLSVREKLAVRRARLFGTGRA